MPRFSNRYQRDGRAFSIVRTSPCSLEALLIHRTVLSGGLTVGGQPDVQRAYHTIVLSASEEEEGVWLEAAEDGLTRGVLIAGEPLQQRVVQVS